MSYNIETIDGVTVVKLPILEELGVLHGFSTKKGGVSEGIYKSMNLSFSRGDDEEAVMENHRRLASSLGYEVESLVFSDQVHKTNIRTVTREDCGKGILKERDYAEIDGLITNDPEVTLITFYADCIPLYFVDPVKKVVAMAHSGWRGTVSRIGQKMIERMSNEFSCERRDIRCVIGPGICQGCYEVSEDVAQEFQREFLEHQWQNILLDKKNGKYQLNLWEANRIILHEAGIAPSNIETSGLCTCCHQDLLFSHRATGGKRGNLAGIISCRGLA